MTGKVNPEKKVRCGQVNLRLDDPTINGLDGLVDAVNQLRPVPRMSRTDLIKIAVLRAIAMGPEKFLAGEE